MDLYHYYEKSVGPFKNLSELPMEEASAIQSNLVDVFAAQRNATYLQRRKYLEELVRSEFIKKGGRPQRATPYYMVVEECPWVATWYKEPAWLRIPLENFDLATRYLGRAHLRPTRLCGGTGME